MIEALAAASCKATFPLMGSAWALSVCEGQWLVAAFALPSLLMFAAFARRYPGRLRGKRAEGPP